MASEEKVYRTLYRANPRTVLNEKMDRHPRTNVMYILSHRRKSSSGQNRTFVSTGSGDFPRNQPKTIKEVRLSSLFAVELDTEIVEPVPLLGYWYGGLEEFVLLVDVTVLEDVRIRVCGLHVYGLLCSESASLSLHSWG